VQRPPWPALTQRCIPKKVSGLFGFVGNRKIFTRNLKVLASGIVGNDKNLHPAFSPGRST